METSSYSTPSSSIPTLFTHLLHTLPQQSITRAQRGLHASLHRLCCLYSLHDGALPPPPVRVPSFLGFLIFFWLRRFASVFFKIKVWSRLLQRATAALRSVSFINAIFHNVAISISATIGLYIVACLIRVSPFSGRGCTPFVKLIDCLVDGSVAYDDFVCTLQTDRFVVVHQHPERLRCTLKHSLFPFFPWAH